MNHRNREVNNLHRNRFSGLQGPYDREMLGYSEGQEALRVDRDRARLRYYHQEEEEAFMSRRIDQDREELSRGMDSTI